MRAQAGRRSNGSTTSVVSSANLITKVYFREGQEVEKGALLFQIEARPYQAAYQQALANRTLKAFDPSTEEWTPLPPDIVELLKADVDRALLEP